MAVTVKICLPGGAVVAEYEGAPPAKGEAFEVWSQQPFADGDPRQDVTRGVVGGRRWSVGAPHHGGEAVCVVTLEDIVEQH